MLLSAVAAALALAALAFLTPARALDPAELLELESVTCQAVALDGDTLLCRLLVPAEHRDALIRVRLWGIAAPEMRERDGWGARAVLDELLANTYAPERYLVGLPGYVTCVPKDRHKARLVAVCTLRDDGRDLGQAVIAAGFATEHRVYTREGPQADAELAARYAQAEWDARRRRKGLWYGLREPLDRSR